MSEYQYYEFQAVDRPLTKQEMAEVRDLSTRAIITATRFVNVYHWGDFKGDPLALMERYYDAFLYVANWGTHQLMFRLPRSVLDQGIALSYVPGDGPFSVHPTREHFILSFNSDTQDPEDWKEGEGWLATLIPLRAEILAGDLRSLYLGWLLCVQEGLLDDEDVEPPVPPGLRELSASLEELAEFLRLEDDLLQVAAERSPAAVQITPSLDQARRWLQAQSDSEKDELLLRMVCGQVLGLQSEVRRRIRNSNADQSVRGVTDPGRTVGELLAGVDRRRQERQRQEAQERERQHQQEVAARIAYLKSLAGSEYEVWRQVETFVEAKRPAEYAEAVRLLTDLRDLAAQEQRAEAFEARLLDLRARHSRKISFLDRLYQAGLQPGQSTR